MKKILIVGLVLLIGMTGSVVAQETSTPSENIIQVTWDNETQGFIIDGSSACGDWNTSDSSPQLTLCEGTDYVFEIDTPGHPFMFSVSDNLADDDSNPVQDVNVTNPVNGSDYATENGTIDINTPVNADENTIYYKSTEDVGQGAVINLVTPPGSTTTTNVFKDLPVFFGRFFGVPGWMIGGVVVLLGLIGYGVYTSESESGGEVFR